MAEPMIPAIVLIVCKTVLAGPVDINADKTGWENRDWAYENSMMICRRQEIQVFDTAEAMGADPQSFNMNRCWASAIRIGAQWDVDHRSSSYRTWRVACPVPLKQDLTGDGPTPDDPIVGWTLPPCGHTDTVICEQDSVI